MGGERRGSAPEPTFNGRSGTGGPGAGSGKQSGGVPDSVLIGFLALLLGLTLFSWSATGIAGLLSHGSWPDGVTFSGTPSAMSSLATQPHDIAAAWPDAPARQLSGYGLFWGIFIGQMMIVLVLTVFVLGTIARARAVRASRRADAVRRDAGFTEGGEAASGESVPAPRGPQQPEPLDLTKDAVAAPDVPAGSVPVQPVPDASATGTRAGIEAALPVTSGAADPYARVRDAPGAALVVTRDPRLWEATRDARSELGPVHLFDPTHLCDAPARFRWSPHHGCEDRATAAGRATALLEPLRSPRPIDADVHTSAETLLRCWLHAAALDGKQFREVHRWAQSASPSAGPVKTLRTHPKAGAGSAGELEAVLAGHPERRSSATELVRRAVGPMSQLHVRDSCTAGRADRVALGSFINETGTLYIVGEDPGILPILNALARSVAEEGRRVAARSSAGRLDPALTEINEFGTPAGA